MSELFRVEVNTINYHLKEIFDSKELEQRRKHNKKTKEESQKIGTNEKMVKYKSKFQF